MANRPARPYQTACVDAVARCINTGYRSLYYALPTGTGKTRIMTLLVDMYRHAGRVLVIAHRKELIEQTAASIRDDIPGVYVGIVMAEKNETSAQVVVGTWQSLTPLRLEHVLQDTAGSIVQEQPFSLILIDEAHHCIKGSAYERIIEQVRQHSPRVAVVGATATPFRSDKAMMQDVLPECAYTKSITEMQADGWLAPLKWQAVKLSMDFSKIKQASVDGEADYNQEELYDVISPQTAEIVAKTAPHFGTRPTMVFAVNVQHAHELADAYNTAGITTMALSAQTNRVLRQDTLTAWKSGAIQCVVNVALFTEGFDFTPLAPNVNGLGVVVIAAPCQSPSRYLQMIGRGTRLKPITGDFKDCIVFDIASNANLLETRQIVLPKVLPTLQEGVFDERSDDAFVSFDGEEEAEMEKEAKPKPPTTLKINDPLATSWLPWGHNIMNNVYYASLSFDKGSQEYALIIPSQRKDGLFRAFILCKNETGWHKQDVTERCKPLQQLMHHINHIIASNGRKSFVHKDNPKRMEMPSPAQMNFLKGKSPKYYQLAMQGNWNKGQVNNVITWLVLIPVVKKLIEKEREQHVENLPTQAQASSVA